jgi:hypothetical protein
MKRLTNLFLTAAAGCGLAAYLTLSAAAVFAQEKPTGAATAKAAGATTKYVAKPTPVPVYPLWPTVIYTKDNAPQTAKLEDLPLKESVSQYDITWTFDKPARVGQFVNGDWYVVGAVTVKTIDPKPLWGDEVKEPMTKEDIKELKYPGKQARNGSQLNPPSKAKTCGFDSRVPSDRYDPDLFAHLPIAMKPGDALVSTISRDNDQLTMWDSQHIDPLRVAAVLTCLAEPVPADAFRPSYCASKNSKIFLARNLKRELLPKLARVAGMPASLEGYARDFQKPWIDLADFGFAAPMQNLQHYGQMIADQVGEGSLLLEMDYPPREKEPVLVGLAQVGIDLYGVARGGFVWQAHGGLNSGRKWPILLAGIMLDDPELKAPQAKLPNLVFHEDQQTAFGPVTYRGQTFETSWTGAKVIFMGHTPYLIKPTKEAEEGHWKDGWGLLDVYPPSQWPLKTEGQLRASEAYRRANTSGAWVAEALAARVLHAEKVWNHDAFFAYEDRWMTEPDTPEHLQAIKDAKFGDFGGPNAAWQRQGSVSVTGSRWVKDAWVKYRDNLPPSADGSKTPPAETTWK